MAISSISGAKVINTLVPINGNTTAEGTGLAVDTNGYQDIMMIANQGVSADTLSGSIYWTVTFQECAVTTAGSFTLIAAGDLEGGLATVLIDAAAEDPTLIVRRYKGKLRYVRILWTQTGTHTVGTPIAGTIILSNPLHMPVTQETELGTPS
jgi:hypothetical protein